MHTYFSREEEEASKIFRETESLQGRIYCVGGRTVEKMALIANPFIQLHHKSLQRTSYVAFHIRRGDFQHKWVKISAEEILVPNFSPFRQGQPCRV